MDFPDFDKEISELETTFPPKAEIEPPPKPEHLRELGFFQGISNEDYHDGPGISSSELKYCLKAMALYQAYKTGVVSFEETEAMRLGTAVHKMVLEAFDFGNEIAVSKKFGRSARDIEAKAEFYAANKGKTIITADQYEKCVRMTDSLLALDEMQMILKKGQPEMSGYYIDKGEEYSAGTGMLCKYRPDWTHPKLLLDVKTTRDISAPAFSKQIHNLNYHVSAAHYLAGHKEATGKALETFVFACVEPEPPYLACMYRLNKESLDLGVEQRRVALNGIKHGRETDEYPLYNDGVSQEIGLPGYAFYESVASKI